MKRGVYAASCVIKCIKKEKCQGDIFCYFHLCLCVNIVYIAAIN
jgi:hypothetical protein